MEEISNESYKMDVKHTKLVRNITNLLQTLCIVGKEVRIATDQTSYSIELQDQDGPFEERPNDASLTTPQIRIKVVVQEIDLGTPELNTMVQDPSHITMYFSALPI